MFRMDGWIEEHAWSPCTHARQRLWASIERSTLGPLLSLPVDADERNTYLPPCTLQRMKHECLLEISVCVCQKQL